MSQCAVSEDQRSVTPALKLWPAWKRLLRGDWVPISFLRLEDCIHAAEDWYIMSYIVLWYMWLYRPRCDCIDCVLYWRLLLIMLCADCYVHAIPIVWNPSPLSCAVCEETVFTARVPAWMLTACCLENAQNPNFTLILCGKFIVIFSSAWRGEEPAWRGEEAVPEWSLWSCETAWR